MGSQEPRLNPASTVTAYIAFSCSRGSFYDEVTPIQSVDREALTMGPDRTVIEDAGYGNLDQSCGFLENDQWRVSSFICDVLMYRRYPRLDDGRTNKSLDRTSGLGPAAAQLPGVRRRRKRCR